MAEYWDVYNRARKPMGKLHVRGVPMAQGEYHLVAQIWIRDNAGRFLIQQRHPSKPWGMWWETAQGSVLAGEDVFEGAIRELREELGLCVGREDLEKIDEVCDEKNTFFDAFLLRWNGDPAQLQLQDIEVVAAKWVTYEELCAVDDAGEFVPSMYYFRSLFDPEQCL